MGLADLADQSVAILGLGREGQSAWQAIRKQYPDQPLALVAETLPEQAFIDQLGPGLDQLIIGDLETILGNPGLTLFDVLIRSPGISPYRPAIARALQAGVSVTSVTNLWFADHPRATTICITGTKGKSTTASLLAHLLGYLGKQVELAGNIGRSLFDCDQNDSDVDYWVIELSSYQLADLQAEPDYGVLLNLSPEHLDWHGGYEQYCRDKLRLADLSRQLVANAADAELKTRLASKSDVDWYNNGQGICIDGDSLYQNNEVLLESMPDTLPGRHNLSNLAAALSLVVLMGLDVHQAIQGLSGFQPLPHRFEYLGSQQGIRYINDSIATTPVATQAALAALPEQSVYLIVGGLDRGLDWSGFAEAILESPPVMIVGIPDNGNAIIGSLQQAGVAPDQGLHQTDSLADAVALIHQHIQQDKPVHNPVVLLSPGAPSFPYFQDFRDRGRQFAELVGFDLPG